MKYFTFIILILLLGVSTLAQEKGKEAKKESPGIVAAKKAFEAGKYKEAIKLLVRLAAHLTDGGLLILINSSGVPEENGQEQELVRAVGLQQLVQSLVEVGKKFCRPLLARTSRVRHPQFWGWQRDNRRYQTIVEEAGLKSVDVFPASGQSFQLTRRVQDPQTQQGFR